MHATGEEPRLVIRDSYPRDMSKPDAKDGAMHRMRCMQSSMAIAYRQPITDHGGFRPRSGLDRRKAAVSLHRNKPEDGVLSRVKWQA